MKDLYHEILKVDNYNIHEIERITGGKWETLDTPEKRALFLLGFRTPGISAGYYTDSDTDQEECIPLNFGATDNDAFYVVCGQDYFGIKR